MNRRLGLIAAAAALVLGTTVSASASAEDAEEEVSVVEKIGTTVSPTGSPRGINEVASRISEADRKAAEQIGRAAAEAVQAQTRTPEFKQQLQQNDGMRKRADQLANAAMQEDRDKVMRFLGLDPEGMTGLYVFVSFSMPKELLRAYAVEAMWSGATLVVKGMPRGKTFKDWMTQEMASLVYGKGASASISIDPRLYDVYDVKAVPTIVYTTDNTMPFCAGTEPHMYGEQQLTINTCSPQDPSKYWKVTGGVTLGWALEQFDKEGARGAKQHLAALQKGYGTQSPAKIQVPFEGKWEDILTPEEREAARQAAEIVTAPSPSAPVAPSR